MSDGAALIAIILGFMAFTLYCGMEAIWKTLRDIERNLRDLHRDE